MNISTEERMERFIRRDGDGCWTWIGFVAPDGYGKFWRTGKSPLAHRAAYELHVGPIPEGLTLDHLCRNRGCVNPAHLEPVTDRENQMRSPIALASVNARKTHCKRGHPFDEANTYIHPLTGRRTCRTCQRAANRRWDHRQRAGI